MKRRARLALASVVTSALLLGGTLAMATGSTGGSDAIKARQQAMEKIGDAMQGLAAIAKKESPFDAGVVAKNAGTIAEQLDAAATLFPKGSHEGDVKTRAKPEIWSDREMFDETLKAAHTAATALGSVNDEAAFRPALGKLGENCKACHEMFRLPTD